MPLTDQDARALTHLACRIRKDTHGASTWDEHGTYANIAKLIGRNLAISAEQVLRHAGDPEAKTPGAIMRPFVPEAPSEKHDRAYPPRRDEVCPRHPAYRAENCGGCVADRLAGPGYDEDAPAPPPPPAWEPASDTTRQAALAAIRAQLHPDDSRDRGEEDTDA